MKNKLHVALMQMDSGPKKQANLKKAYAMAKEAILKGAEFVLFPETFNVRAPAHKIAQEAENIPEINQEITLDNASLYELAMLAKQHKVAILAGSIYEKIAHSKKVYNTSVLINTQGCVLAKYRKIHLFKVAFAKVSINEKDYYEAGQKPALVETAHFKAGLGICFDLRFAELFRYYAKNEPAIICLPSSFTQKTGKMHWEVLLRARAIENQCFMLAPNQVGTGHHQVACYGHSLVVDPMGKVLARGSGNKEEIVQVKIDLESIKKVKKLYNSQPQIISSLIKLDIW